jgi:TonB family protein
VNGARSRLRRLVDAIDARLRGSQKAARAVVALLGLALVAVLAAAAWLITMELWAEGVAVADPRRVYVHRVEQKIQDVTHAALASARPRELPAGLKLRIQLDAEGNLISATVTESSGDADLDELTVRIIRTAAPFGSFPPEMRRTTEVVELNSEFYFH